MDAVPVINPSRDNNHMAKLSPVFNEQTLDSDNFLLSGGKVYWYLAGTSTPATTYIDADGITPNANPVVLNSRGEPNSGGIWLAEGIAYKAVLKDAADVLIRTIDNIRGINDVDDQTLSEWVLFSGAATYLSATTFSVSGNHVSTFSTNRRLKATITAGTWYGQVASASYSSGITTVTVDNDGTTLDSGLATVYYGVISEKSTALQAAYDYTDAALAALSGAIHSYMAAGTYTLAIPAWAKSAELQVWGAGAGALGGIHLTERVVSGGSSGGYNASVVDVSTGGSLDIVIGAGGAGAIDASTSGYGASTTISLASTVILAATGGDACSQDTSGGDTLPIPGTPGTGSIAGQYGESGFVNAPGYFYGRGGHAPFGGAGGQISRQSAGISGKVPGGGGGSGLIGGVTPTAGDGAPGGAIVKFLPF